MNKKLRTILCVLVLIGVGSVTVWRSCVDLRNGDAREEVTEEGRADKGYADEGQADPADGSVLTHPDNVVTVRCETGSGNGVLLCQTEKGYVIATAGHVVDGLQGKAEEELQMEIAGLKVCASKLWVSDIYDVAFIEILMTETEEVLKEKHFAGLSEEGFTNLKEGDRLYVRSYLKGELTTLEITVNSPWILVEDFGYHMIWASAKDAKGGMSGSGVFDLKGHLAGILCGGNDTEVAVLPVNIILGELKNSSIDISFD